MSKRQRRTQIMEFLYAQTETVLISEIGKGVGLKVTPYLRALLDSLEMDGEIYVQWAMHPQYGWSRFYAAVRE